MKWNKRCPLQGDTRIINKFLLFPKKINSQVRWLETVKIKQRYTVYCDIADASYKAYWEDIEWVD